MTGFYTHITELKSQSVRQFLINWTKTLSTTIQMSDRRPSLSRAPLLVRSKIVLSKYSF
jgi:hypothetical protein